MMVVQEAGMRLHLAGALLGVLLSGFVGPPSHASMSAPVSAEPVTRPNNTEAAAVEGIIKRPDVTLHHKMMGDHGPYVVMLAGGPGGSVGMMRPICDHLKSRFRCVLLEQRGTDRSVPQQYSSKAFSFEAYLEDIEALRRHLGQDRLILLGNSWGMTLGFAYAGSFPDKVQALATLGSGGLTVSHFKQFRDNRQVRVSAAQEERIADLQKQGLPVDQLVAEIAKTLMPTYFFNREAAARSAAAVRVGDINFRLGEYTEAILARSDELAFGRLDQITAPVLLVQGRQDLAPEEVARVVEDKVGNAELVLLDECGHMPWLDQPTATWNALDRFLEEHTS
jgi:proline iminopeptidase